MIKKPNELTFENKKFVVILAGVPGIGKTTLALSSPKPLLIDLDNGISRVKAQHRCDTLIAENYEELLDDLSNNDLSFYETIVIDTGGKLLEFLKPVVIAEDQKNGKRDGNLSLQGYGAVKRKFSDFVNFVKGLKKHLIIVFHATEVALANDVTGLRIRIEGSSRDEIWDDADLGGFVEMAGKKRTLNFTNCERYYAKGTHGISGSFEIPNLDVQKKNNFISLLFDKMLDNLKREAEEMALYNENMKLKDEIVEIKDLNEVNTYLEVIKKMNHSLTSKEELWTHLSNKAKELGYKYDKEKEIFSDGKSS